MEANKRLDNVAALIVMIANIESYLLEFGIENKRHHNDGIKRSLRELLKIKEDLMHG